LVLPEIQIPLFGLFKVCGKVSGYSFTTVGRPFFDSHFLHPKGYRKRGYWKTLLLPLRALFHEQVVNIKNSPNRSQVQGSTFRVKEKEGIEDPEASLKRLIFPSNCQFGSKFWITPEEAEAFLVNMHPKCIPGARMEL